MGNRLNNTLLNWRWWVALPAFVALTPVVLLDLALAALVTTGEVAEDLRDWMRGTMAPLGRFVRKGWAP